MKERAQKGEKGDQVSNSVFVIPCKQNLTLGNAVLVFKRYIQRLSPQREEYLPFCVQHQQKQR